MTEKSSASNAKYVRVSRHRPQKRVDVFTYCANRMVKPCYIQCEKCEQIWKEIYEKDQTNEVLSDSLERLQTTEIRMSPES